MNAFHRWLISKRIYCERGEPTHLVPATHVIKDKGRDVCVCSDHEWEYKAKKSRCAAAHTSEHFNTERTDGPQ